MWPCATGSETENRNWTGQYRDHNSERPRAARCAINVCGTWVLPTGRHSGSGRRTPWQLQQPQPQPDPTVGSAFDPRPQQPGIPGGGMDGCRRWLLVLLLLQLLLWDCLLLWRLAAGLLFWGFYELHRRQHGRVTQKDQGKKRKRERERKRQRNAQVTWISLVIIII